MDEQLWPGGESGGDPCAYCCTHSNPGARVYAERRRAAESRSSANAQSVSDAGADACPDSLP
jgi:hypothetical protein